MRIFRRRTPTPEAQPYWSKTEPPAEAAAADAGDWPQHDTPSTSAEAGPTVAPGAPDESPPATQPEARDTYTRDESVVDASAADPAGEDSPAATSDSAEPTTNTETVSPDPWESQPAGEAWQSLPPAAPWEAGAATASTDPGQAASSADDEPRLAAWSGEPAGEADGQFAAAPQTAEADGGAPADAATDGDAPSDARGDADGLEMERLPSDASTTGAADAVTDQSVDARGSEPEDADADAEVESPGAVDEAVTRSDEPEAEVQTEAAAETAEAPESAPGPELAAEAQVADDPEVAAATGIAEEPEVAAEAQVAGDTGVAVEDAPETAADSETDAETQDGTETVSVPIVDETEDAPDEATGSADTQAEARPRHAELGLSDDDVLAMYRQMLLARAVDERMWLLQRAGRIAFVISGQGHEGAQVAIAWPLRKGHDWMAPYYRSVASVMTFGMTSEEIIAAHLAKADDPSSGGRQMPGHYGGAAYNIISTSSPVGTQALHATGIAMGAWVRGDDVVAITYFGEGTSNQGEVHEAMNFAGVHKLPVIFVCENNGYAISVPLDKQVGGGSVAIRAEGYGFPGVTVDGTDVLECYEVAREAIERARQGEGPTLIEARVVRMTSHSSDDDQRRYRDPDEVTALTERDPIAIFGRELREIGLLTDEVEERMRAEIKQEINDASRAAEARPDPDTEAAEKWVYAPDDAGASEDR